MTHTVDAQVADYVATLPKFQNGHASGWRRTRINPCAIVFSCTKCHEYAPVTDFYRYTNRNGRVDILGNHLATRCKRCSNEEYIELDHRKKLYHSAKRRATEKGLEFTITHEDIVIPEYCPVLGIKLKASVGTGKLPIDKLWVSPTVDRLDNDEGYTPRNIRVISHRANSLKNNASLDELKAIVQYMEQGIAEKNASFLTAHTKHPQEVER